MNNKRKEEAIEYANQFVDPINPDEILFDLRYNEYLNNNGWISVDDELPISSGEYWVEVYDENLNTTIVYRDKFYNNIKEFNIEKVINWQYIKPPKSSIRI